MTSTPRRHFDTDYREVLRLRDGSEVVFRLIGPNDKRLLADGIERMSPESRFRRFFAYRDHLTAHELAYLTEYDHHHHIAIGVGEAAKPHHGLPVGAERGLGVARFVRLGAPDSTVAEAAVAIVDDAQGKGLGRMLLDRLMAAATERGIRTFRFDVLAENDAMRGLIERLFPGTAEDIADAEPGVISLACPLPAPREHGEHGEHDALIYRLFRMAAQGTLRILRAFRTHPAPHHTTLHDAIGLDDDDGPAPVAR